MSDLIGAGQPAIILDYSISDEVLPAWWQLDYELGAELALGKGLVPIDQWLDNLVGDQGLDGAYLDEGYFEWIEITAGCNGRYGFAGVTRDVYGSPLGGCTVKCFLTADDSLISQTTSNALGEFLLTTHYYPNTHYLVSFKTDFPDVSGASVNTLIGA